MPAPFFIIGTPRSGTTLLSVLLENHSQLYVDGDSIGISLAREFGAYKRTLSRNPGIPKEELITKICKKSYKGRLAKVIRYQDADKYPDLRSLLSASVDQFAANAGKKVWGDKTPELVFHLPQILELFPNAKILHLYRDAHANVSSLVERQYYPLDLAAQYWKEINGLGLAYQQMIGTQQYSMIQYEQLLLEPEATMKAICQFLEVPFEAAALDLGQASATKEKGAYVSGSIDASKIHSWKRKVTPKQVLRIEQICGDLLDQLGYELHEMKDPSKARSISYRRQFWLRQRMTFRMLFKRNRVQMIDRKLIKAKIPFRQRAQNFVFGTISHFFSEKFIRVFKSNY